MTPVFVVLTHETLPEVTASLNNYQEFIAHGWVPIHIQSSCQLRQYLAQDTNLIRNNSLVFADVCALQELPTDLLRAMFDLRESTGVRDFQELLSLSLTSWAVNRYP